MAKKISLVVLGLALIYLGRASGPQDSRERVMALESEIQQLRQRNQALEKQLAEATKPAEVKPAVAEPLAAPPAPVPAPAPDPYARILDRPAPGRESCSFATINSHTKLAVGLVWNSRRGENFVGDLPAGSIVEILSTDLLRWTDYPDEHAVYVYVVEAPAAPQIENQKGYIELKRINQKSCNLGAEFEK